jgi:hypothetical protein
MADAQIQPHRITKPIQLLAVWMLGLVILDGTFLGAARFLEKPEWLPPVLVISAVAFVPLFLIALFLLQTKFRPQLQEDVYYAEWLATQTQVFKNFAPENLPSRKLRAPISEPDVLDRAFGGSDLENIRVRKYEKYQGVFLVHSWRPSRQPGQAADIVLLLRQHGDGPLKSGLVDRVEYALGPKFFEGPVVKMNREESFRLEVSVYAPMLCVARVWLANGSSFDLERYADFASIVGPDIVKGRSGKKGWGSPPVTLETD